MNTMFLWMNRFAVGILVIGSGAFMWAANPSACDADNGGIKLPPGFCAVVAADGIGEARHVAVAPNGDIYVALRGRNQGGVVALRDTNGDGKFETKEQFGECSSTGIALRNGYLYVATVNAVIRYKMTPGELKPAGAAGDGGRRSSGQRGSTATRASLSTAKGRSTSMSARLRTPASRATGSRNRRARIRARCLNEHGGIWKFDENKLGQKQADGVRCATGMRQMPAITWHDGALYVVMNNRDQLDILWPEHVHGEGERRAAGRADVSRR